MNKITNLASNLYTNSYSGDAVETGLGVGVVLIIIFCWIAFAVLFFVGVYFALKTEDVEVNKGRFFLHLLIFGFFVGAITYLITVNGNKLDRIAARSVKPTTTKTQPTTEPKTPKAAPKTTTTKAKVSQTTKDQKIAKIDKLLKEKRITKAEYKSLMSKIK